MSKIKFNQKIICSFLLLAMLGMSIFQATNFLSNNVASANSNNVSIETIDDNTAKIHYNNATATNKDILFTKEQQGEKFNYVVSDFETKKELCNFASAYDLNLNNTSSVKNKNVCAAAYAIFKAVSRGGDPIEAILEVGGAIGALGEGTLVAIADLIATEGILAIPEIIGLLSASEAAVALGSAAAIA